MGRKYYRDYSYYKKKRVSKNEVKFVFYMMFFLITFMILVFVLKMVELTIGLLFETRMIQIGVGLFIVYYVYKKRHKIVFMFKSKDEQYRFLIDVLRRIRRLNYQKIRDEEGLEDQLMIHLEHLGYDVVRQEVKKGKKIDLIVNKEYALELKLFEGKTSELQRLSGQIEDYLELFKYVGVIVFTSKRYDNDELSKYLRRYNAKDNVYAVKVVGNIRRKKPTNRYVLVK